MSSTRGTTTHIADELLRALGSWKDGDQVATPNELAWRRLLERLDSLSPSDCVDLERVLVGSFRSFGGWRVRRAPSSVFAHLEWIAAVRPPASEARLRELMVSEELAGVKHDNIELHGRLLITLGNYEYDDQLLGFAERYILGSEHSFPDRLSVFLGFHFAPAPWVLGMLEALSPVLESSCDDAYVEMIVASIWSIHGALPILKWMLDSPLESITASVLLASKTWNAVTKVAERAAVDDHAGWASAILYIALSSRGMFPLAKLEAALARVRQHNREEWIRSLARMWHLSLAAGHRWYPLAPSVDVAQLLPQSAIGPRGTHVFDERSNSHYPVSERSYEMLMRAVPPEEVTDSRY